MAGRVEYTQVLFRVVENSNIWYGWSVKAAEREFALERGESVAVGEWRTNLVTVNGNERSGIEGFRKTRVDGWESDGSRLDV